MDLLARALLVAHDRLRERVAKLLLESGRTTSGLFRFHAGGVSDDPAEVSAATWPERLCWVRFSGGVYVHVSKAIAMNDEKRIHKQLKMGTTEVLVLVVLTRGDQYGYEISRNVRESSGGYFELQQGFLYPTLRRMETAKLIRGYWRRSSSGGPNRRYYRLTKKGKARLETTIEAWSDFNKQFKRMVAGRQK